MLTQQLTRTNSTIDLVDESVEGDLIKSYPTNAVHLHRPGVYFIVGGTELSSIEAPKIH